MSQQIYFITGTDTGIGKTTITIALLKKYNQAGQQSVGLKPLASGCQLTAEGLRNDDALRLQSASSIALPYETINPIAYQQPIAPYLAASMAGENLSVDSLIQACQPGLQTNADITFIEGVGGWFQPLNEKQNMAEFSAALSLPVIMVVGMRLGCINHSLLTQQSIKHYQLNLAGWVANVIDPEMDCIEENIALLTRAIDAPLLAVVPYQSGEVEVSWNAELS